MFFVFHIFVLCLRPVCPAATSDGLLCLALHLSSTGIACVSGHVDVVKRLLCLAEVCGPELVHVQVKANTAAEAACELSQTHLPHRKMPYCHSHLRSGRSLPVGADIVLPPSELIATAFGSLMSPAPVMSASLARLRLHRYQSLQGLLLCLLHSSLSS